MFRMQQALHGPTTATRRAPISLEPVSDEGAPAAPSPPSSAPASSSSLSSSPSGSSSSSARGRGLFDPTIVNDEPPAPLADPTTADLTVELSRALPETAVSPRPLRPRPPRHLLVAAALVAGLASGAVVAVAGRPASPLGSPGDGVVVAAVPVARPALCPDRTPSTEDAAQAAALLDEARGLKRDGATPTQVVERLRRAASLDPASAPVFYELGRLVSGRDAVDADTCVCVLAPSSRECAALEKANGR
jgi:hypothetical protein